MVNSGIVLLAKPRDKSSFWLVREARQKLGIKKIGHAGTLDPFATGLMILAVSKATKALEHLQLANKTYKAELILGQSSTTHDSEGEISLSYQGKAPDLATISKALAELKKQEKQRPPIFSAVKSNGRRAYTLARSGERPKLKSKQVSLYDWEIINYKWPHLELKIEVSSGYYVRALARDLGAKLKTGAYCQELERLKIANFSLDQAILIEDLTKENIEALKPSYFQFTDLALAEEQLRALKQGKAIEARFCAPGVSSASFADEVVAFGVLKEGYFYPKKVLL
jgi:tRNA pseudouridine55 synthase